LAGFGKGKFLGQVKKLFRLYIWKQLLKAIDNEDDYSFTMVVIITVSFMWRNEQLP